MNTDIELREFQDSDQALFRKWVYEKHVARWYEHPTDWINEIENRKEVFSWIHHFITECEGVPIGFCQYYEYCLSGETWHGDISLNGTYSIDYLIGNKEYIGRGFGNKTILALVELIRSCKNARIIIVQPEEENKASCGALLSAGFVFDVKNRLFRLDL